MSEDEIKQQVTAAAEPKITSDTISHNQPFDLTEHGVQQLLDSKTTALGRIAASYFTSAGKIR